MLRLRRNQLPLVTLYFRNGEKSRMNVIGPAHATVTIVEYGDFECPNCKQAAPVCKLLVQRFAGRVRFVYRHYPQEEVHPHALFAAEAAEAAASQGKFWEMHDLLYANQSHLTLPDLHRYAEDLALDMRRYQGELKDHLHLQRVREDQQDGRARGVRATPTFFLNGNICDVSFGVGALEQTIEAALRADT
jgi:protein-disulfide isomerase